MKRINYWIILMLALGWMGFSVTWAQENKLLALNAGIDRLVFDLTSHIASHYFKVDKRPVVKVAVFDFTDSDENITVGSRYVTNRIRVAFAEGLQFELLTTEIMEEENFVVTAKAFSENRDLRERLLDKLKADVYVFGTLSLQGSMEMICDATIWGIAPPYDKWYRVKPMEFEDALPWKLGFTPSGTRFFNHVLVDGVQEAMREIKRENLGKVVFLSQPICDDLSLSWQVRSDGMVYDSRKESKAGSLANRTGQVLQSRVKSGETLKELSYIINDASLVIKEERGLAYKFEPYTISESSDYFYIPFMDNETGLRFQYLWAKTGLSKRVSTMDTGKGWKLHQALDDYENIMPLGVHIATATLSPMAESQYGSKRPRSEYVTRFKFSVTPGLNIYVVNYVYRRDKPEIFVRRLEIEAIKDVPIRSIKRITEVYRVYGSD